MGKRGKKQEREGSRGRFARPAGQLSHPSLRSRRRSLARQASGEGAVGDGYPFGESERACVECHERVALINHDDDVSILPCARGRDRDGRNAASQLGPATRVRGAG
jgi:hypothetical protein